jgi:hypothetical protein
MIVGRALRAGREARASPGFRPPGARRQYPNVRGPRRTCSSSPTSPHCSIHDRNAYDSVHRHTKNLQHISKHGCPSQRKHGRDESESSELIFKAFSPYGLTARDCKAFNRQAKRFTYINLRKFLKESRWHAGSESGVFLADLAYWMKTSRFPQIGASFRRMRVRWPNKRTRKVGMIQCCIFFAQSQKRGDDSSLQVLSQLRVNNYISCELYQ